MFQRYVCIRQQDISDCGAACLATVLETYGSRLPIARIRDVAGTDRQGTNAYGMVKAAKELGFEARAVKGDRAALFSEFPLPAIAHMVMEDSLLHYMVIHKITEKKITLADPAKGLVSYSPDEFCKLWSGVLILLAPGEGFKAADERQSVWERFWRLLAPQKDILAYVFLLSLLITGAGIAASFYYLLIMDRILPADSNHMLLPISLGVLGLYLARGGLEYARGRLMLFLSRRIDLSLIPEYNRRLLRLPMRFFGARRRGEIVSRYSDAANIRNLLSEAALTIMIDTLMAIVGGFILYAQSRELFLIALAVIALYGVVIAAFNGPIRKANEQTMERNAQFASYLYESVDGIETVKAFGGENRAREKAGTLYEKFWESVSRNWIITLSQTEIAKVIAVVGETVILWVGTRSVLRGQLTIGTLITFHALLAYFLQPARNLLDLQPMIQTAVVAVQRLGDVMDLSPEEDSAAASDASLWGDIEFSHVSFRYGTREPVLQDISLTIAPGEQVAFIGESGSGKTTLARLLLRFYDCESGSVRIGGRDIKEIPLRSLRGRIAYISQDTFLFSGTIRENLLFANPDATRDDIIGACRMSGASAFIEEMPLKYETRLDENGANLSGGQRQRLAIARALLRKPDILIMDEATSNLDSIAERAIEKTLASLSKRTTAIRIAHRLNTIRNCDRIYVLSHGRIAEYGAHEALLRKGGAYAALWKEQSL